MKDSERNSLLTIIGDMAVNHWAPGERVSKEWGAEGVLIRDRFISLLPDDRITGWCAIKLFIRVTFARTVELGAG